MLLTGSLSGILAIAFGLIVAGLTALVSGVRAAKRLARGLVVLPFAIAIFYLFAVSNTSRGVNLCCDTRG